MGTVNQEPIIKNDGQDKQSHCSGASGKQSSTNPKTKRRRMKRVRQHKRIADLLHKVRPSVFTFDQPKPLVIGVESQILDKLDVNPNVLKRFLAWWCNRKKYLTELASDDSYRYHMSGRRGKKVDPLAREIAKDKLKQRRELWKTPNQKQN